MKVCALILAGLAFAAASYVSEEKYRTSIPTLGEKYVIGEKSGKGVVASKEFLFKQKFFLEILRHIHQPIQYAEYLPYTKTLVMDKSKYSNWEEVYKFIKMYELKVFLPQGRIFSIYNEAFAEQTEALYNLFYHSSDWETFYHNVIWARQHMNSGMFVHALTMAVLHRSDLDGIILPAPYEIYPSFFFNTRVITKGKQYKLWGLHKKDFTYIIPANYTSTYYMDDAGEQRLAYFTEDIGLNSYHYYFNLDYPYFIGGSTVELKKDNRGELFLYTYQQLLARYYLERISNDLGEIPDFSWDQGIDTGYWPMLRYYNGIEFPTRGDGYDTDDMDVEMLDLIKDYEMRIRRMIDRGYIQLEDGKRVDIRHPGAIDKIGNLIQGNPASLNNRFHKYIQVFAHLLVGGTNTYDMDDYWQVPSVMEHFQTAMRDPVFYQLYKRIVRFWHQYKDQLPEYTAAELYVPGIKIMDVHIDKLVTFFDYFEADLSNAVDMDLYSKPENGEFNQRTEKFQLYKNVMKGATWDYVFKVRQPRLNHKPFTVTVGVKAEVAGKYVVRFFFGPRVLNRYQLDNHRQHFVEWDQFLFDLKAGKNTIVRNSRDFEYTVRDRTTYADLYRKVVLAIDEEEKHEFYLDNSEAHLGFPDRLLLPKGKVGGMPFTFYVIISKYVEPKVQQFSTYDERVSLGIGSGSRYLDGLPMGYPFDRKINILNFFTPNMYFEDVLVYQYAEYDITSRNHLNNIYLMDLMPMDTVRQPLNCEYFTTYGFWDWMIKMNIDMPSLDKRLYHDCYKTNKSYQEVKHEKLPLQGVKEYDSRYLGQNLLDTSGHVDSAEHMVVNKEPSFHDEYRYIEPLKNFQRQGYGFDGIKH